MSEPILPGASIGVVGGGQLGRMFAASARRMGYSVLALTPDARDPAAQWADGIVEGALDDPDAIERLARQVESLTLEFENVDIRALAAAEGLAPLRPGLRLLELARDRRLEKTGLAKLGLPVADFAVIESDADLAPAAARVGMPAVLKTALSGYDGKGQRRVEASSQLEEAWDGLGRRPAVLERRVSFVAEISVIAARGHDGEVALYDPIWNDHVDHVLDVSIAPAPVTAEVAAEAARIARTILQGLDVVGVLCVELFLLEDGRLLVNEIAPRPHNSGHLTIEGHACSQFEQQVRAACALPLGSSERTVDAVAMANILGQHLAPGPPNWEAALAVPGVRLHLYGKAEARPGRKMGHLTAVASTPEQAAQRARLARARLQDTSFPAADEEDERGSSDDSPPGPTARRHARIAAERDVTGV